MGQVEVVSFHFFQQRSDEPGADLNNLNDQKGKELAALLVTDIVKETSLLLTAGPKQQPYLIGTPSLQDNLYRLDGVLSRKKQLVPHLLKIFKGGAGVV